MLVDIDEAETESAEAELLRFADHFLRQRQALYGRNDRIHADYDVACREVIRFAESFEVFQAFFVWYYIRFDDSSTVASSCGVEDDFVFHFAHCLGSWFCRQSFGDEYGGLDFVVFQLFDPVVVEGNVAAFCDSEFEHYDFPFCVLNVFLLDYLRKQYIDDLIIHQAGEMTSSQLLCLMYFVFLSVLKVRKGDFR